MCAECLDVKHVEYFELRYYEFDYLNFSLRYYECPPATFLLLMWLVFQGPFFISPFTLRICKDQIYSPPSIMQEESLIFESSSLWWYWDFKVTDRVFILLSFSSSPHADNKWKLESRSRFLAIFLFLMQIFFPKNKLSLKHFKLNIYKSRAFVKEN